MSISINECQFAGNLVRDMEDRTSGSGTAIATSAIAVNERVKRDGQWVEEAIFLDFTCFGKTAENCVKHLAKGDAVHLRGRVQMDRWKDKETGADRSKMKVVAEKVTFLKWGKDNAPSNHTAGQTPAPPGVSGSTPF